MASTTAATDPLSELNECRRIGAVDEQSLVTFRQET
jgi:hypothetical protein